MLEENKVVFLLMPFLKYTAFSHICISFSAHSGKFLTFFFLFHAPAPCKVGHSVNAFDDDNKLAISKDG